MISNFLNFACFLGRFIGCIFTLAWFCQGSFRTIKWLSKFVVERRSKNGRRVYDLFQTKLKTFKLKGTVLYWFINFVIFYKKSVLLKYKTKCLVVCNYPSQTKKVESQSLLTTLLEHVKVCLYKLVSQKWPEAHYICMHLTGQTFSLIFVSFSSHTLLKPLGLVKIKMNG